MPDLLDLSEHYNCSLTEELSSESPFSLETIPKGIQLYADAVFDVRGMIRLSGRNDIDSDTGSFPQSIGPIRVDRTIRKLHFLHGVIGTEEREKEIASYTLQYDDGQRRRIPLTYGRNIANVLDDHEGTALADACTTRSVDEAGRGLALYTYTIHNPLAEKQLSTIEFEMENDACADPFLIAVTIEPTETIYLNFSDGTRPVNTIMPRNRWAHADMVDLSRYFNASLDDDWHKHEGHDLQDVPKGIQEFGEVTFDVRGLIQLAAGNISLRRTGAVYPEKVEGIEVNRYAEKIHFLHACGWSTESDTPVGAYRLNYSDGQSRTLDLIYGRNITDWWVNPDTQLSEDTEVVWKGYNSFCRNLGVQVQLLRFSCENPLPDTKISSIDFISYLETAGPFLLAITLENDG